MNSKKLKILSLLMMGIFILSVHGHTATQVQAQTIETNFEALLLTQAGSRIRESYAFYVKQALAPLGIDVQILAKPFGQFVGDLLHISTGQPFDFAIIGFAGGGPTPGFMWKFHSTDTSFGQLMYQLDNSEWQDWQEQDIGVTTSEIDQLLENLEFENNLTRRKELVDEFSKLFMEELLYDYPLTTITGRTALWAGLGTWDANAGEFVGGEFLNNTGWDADEGIYASRQLGAGWNWDAVPDARKESDTIGDYATGQSNLTTLQLSTATPGSPGNFDPYQVFDTATGQQSNYLTDSLLTFDKQFEPHPQMAQQWIVEDWDNGTHVSSNGKHTFVMNPNYIFPETQNLKVGTTAPFDASGDPNEAELVSFGPEALDANDVAFTIAMLKMARNGSQEEAPWAMDINGLELYDKVVDWNVSTTVTPDDTITFYLAPGETTPDDMVTLGGLNPLPEHILNRTLHWANTSTTTVLDDYYQNETLSYSHNPQNSAEWQYWQSADGISLAGEMALDEYDADNGFWSFNARADFPYPNEWDIMNTVQSEGNTTFYNALTDDSGLIGENFTADEAYYFAPHRYDQADAYYWAFNEVADNMAKPTSTGFEHVVVKIIDDTNANLLAFEGGTIDFFGSSALGANTVTQHENNPDYLVQEPLAISGPQLLVFNLLNPHLRKSQVRQAVALAIDKQALIDINEGYAEETNSPVWKVYDRFQPPEFVEENLSWYEDFYPAGDEDGYNYAKARDLMRDNDYFAQDSPDPDRSAQQPPVTRVIDTIVGELGSEALIGFSAFAITSVVLVRRRKY